MMRGKPAVLAVVFDFDETLLPDSTSQLLESRGVDPKEFWTNHVRRRAEQGFDPTLAYLGLILEWVGAERPLGFRIISGGLLEVVLGSEIVRRHFTGVRGCEFADDPGTSCIAEVKRAITFTEKTRYLFEINKGVEPSDTLKNPYVVNRDVAPAARPVPFSNMIYVGDGLTDIPCFSLLKKEHGTSFGVFDPARKESARRAFTEFLQTDRVISMHAPRYGRGDELGSFLRTAVATRASTITLQRAQPESSL